MSIAKFLLKEWQIFFLLLYLTNETQLNIHE